MKNKSPLLIITTVCSLLMATSALLAVQPTRASGDKLVTTQASTGNDTFRLTTVYTFYTLIISNEAPGRLVDNLIAHGHGGDTMIQVLGYLKDQSSGIISDEFYTGAASAPTDSLIYTTHLSDYASWPGIEIDDHGGIGEGYPLGSNYDGKSGYETTSSQDGGFIFTSAQDSAHYIWTRTLEIGPDIYHFYAFAIAWRDGYNVFLPLIKR